MLRIFLFLLFISLPVAAVDSIYTWGYGKDIFNIITSIKFLTGNSSYLISAAITISMLMVFYKETQDNNTQRIAKVAFLALFLSHYFFHSGKDYMVEDEVTNQTWAVTDIPVGIGELFSLFTTLERILLKGSEYTFSTPNSLSYSKVGLGFSMTTHLSTNSASFIDGNAHETFMEYTTNCIASGMLDGQIDKNLIASEDIVGDIRVEGFETIVYKSDGTYEQLSCQDSYDNYIVKYFQDESNSYIQNRLAAQMSLDPTVVSNGLQDTSSLFFGVSKSGRDYVMQQMGRNMLKKGLNVMAMTTGGDTQALAYSSAVSSASMENQWQQSGIMAQSTLPMIKAYITSIVLAMTPFLALLAIMFGDWKHIKMIINLLITLMLFSPIASIINYLMYLRLEEIIPIMSQNLWMPMLAMRDINSQIYSYLNFLGYAAMTIPLLAYSLVKASEQGFVNFMSGMGSSVSSAASQGATQKTTGANLGNTRVGGSSYTGFDGVTTAMGGGATQNNSIQETQQGAYTDQTTTSASGNTNSNLTNSVADITTANGQLSSISYKNLGADITNSHQNSYNQARALEASTLSSLSNTLSTGLSQSMANGQIYTNSDDFSKNTGLNSLDSRAIVQSQNEAITSALNQKLAEAQNSGTTSEAGFKLGGHVGWGTDDTAIGFISGVKTGVDGSMHITGTSTDGKSFSVDLSKDDTANLQKSVNENLSKTFNEDSGLTLRASKSLADNEVFSNSDLKSNMDAYTSASSKADKFSENYSKTNSDSISFASKVMPQITEQFIQNDERLKGMYESGDIRASKNALSEASFRINEAYKSGVGHDYRILNDAFKSITGFDARGNLANLVDENINSAKSLEQDVNNDILKGYNKIDNSDVKNTINQDPTTAYNQNATTFKDESISSMNEHKDKVSLNTGKYIDKGGDEIKYRRDDFIDDSRIGKAFVATGGNNPSEDIAQGLANLKNLNEDTAHSTKSGKEITTNELAGVKTQIDYLKDDIEASKYQQQPIIPSKKGK